MALQVTQVKSANGAKKRQLATLQTLGLRRIRHTVVVPDQPQFRGMVAAINHLVAVTEVPDDTVLDATATVDVSADDAGEPGQIGTDAIGASEAVEELLDSQGIEGGADSSADVVQLPSQNNPMRGEKVKGGGGADDDEDVETVAAEAPIDTTEE